MTINYTVCNHAAQPQSMRPTHSNTAKRHLCSHFIINDS